MPNETSPPLSEYEQDYLFDVQGFRVLSGALTPDQLGRINGWVDAQPPRLPGEWAGNVLVHSYSGPDGTNYQNIFEGGDVFEEIIDHPAWIAEVRRYIASDYNGVLINEAFLNVRGQSGYIGIHSGGALVSPINTFRHHTGAWQLGQINILMALTDIGLGDGATVVVPGSHKANMIHPSLMESKTKSYRDDQAAGRALRTEEVHLKAGDALMFTDSITHGSAARINPGERRVMIYRYSPHVIIPRYNFVPSEALLSRLTPSRRLLVQSTPPKLAPGQTLRG